jgi:integrase
MSEKMRKPNAKPHRAQQNAHFVAPTKKPSKMAENASTGSPSAALAKRTSKRRERRQPVALTIPEKDRFFKAIRSARDTAIFRLLYHHGLRASEPGQLKFSDYRPGSSLNLDRILLHRLKNSVSGEVGVVPAAALAVRAWIRKRGHQEGPLFPSRQKGPISRFRIFALMRRYCAAAGIPTEKQHPHCLKHTCAVHLLADKKESLVNVQRHLGHTDVRSTMRYLETLDDSFNEERIRRLAQWR